MTQSITPKISPDPRFVNGFENWLETHYEVVEAITIEALKDKPSGKVLEVRESQGHVGLYDLATSLTNEFERRNQGRQWDGEFQDEIQAFMEVELKK